MRDRKGLTVGRRGNSEGTFFKLENGTWQGRIRLGGERKSLYGKTRKEVQTKIREAQRAHEEGRLITGRAKKTGDYLNEWLEGQVRLTVQLTTYDTYKRDVERLRPFIGSVRLDALRYEHIQKAYTELLKTLSETSVHRVHRALKTALRHAVKLGIIGYNPIERVTPPRPPHKEMRPLTPAEVARFLDTTRCDHLHALWVLLVTTGLRVGEATGLRWTDINLESCQLHVRTTVKRIKGQGLTIGDTKTASSRRCIELAHSTVAALRTHQQEQKWTRRITGKEWNDDGLVFCTEAGGPLDAGYVGHAKDRALDAAGLPHVRTHDLRHTTASYLLSQGVHPKVVQELLGHSSITLTMNTYSHVLPTLHKDVANHMDRLYQATESAP
jgi:integrase